ncbi:MAG: hypothetical protein ACFB4J_01585 [Elainellaceae cyanobacterium]
MFRTVAHQSPLLFIASLLLLALGLGVNLWWTVYGGFELSLWLVNIVPGLILLLTGYGVSRARRRRWLWRAVGIFFTLLSTTLIILLNLVGYAFESATRPITDPAEYATVRSQFGDADHIQHFPPMIPPEATAVQFYYQRGALQGAMSLQLRVELPEGTWQQIKARYEPQARYQVSAAALDAPEFDAPVSIPRFWVGDRDTRRFPGTYTLLFLSAPSAPLYSYGVAVNPSPPTIVYWVEGGN